MLLSDFCFGNAQRRRPLDMQKVAGILFLREDCEEEEDHREVFRSLDIHSVLFLHWAEAKIRILSFEFYNLPLGVAIMQMKTRLLSFLPDRPFDGSIDKKSRLCGCLVVKHLSIC